MLEHNRIYYNIIQYNINDIVYNIINYGII